MMKSNMEDALKDIVNAIKKAETIAILTHVSMDGDCLGSSLGLALGLKKVNKKPIIVAESEVTAYLSFLPSLDLVELKVDNDYKADLCIAVDCGDINRFKDRREIFDNAKETANIDHHKSNDGYANYNYVDTGKAATAEIIYDLLADMKIELDDDIATCLYVGIASDTGGFRYGNTTPNSHVLASKLMGYGLDIPSLSERIFNYTSMSILKLTSRALGNLKLYYGNSLAVAFVSLQDFKECNASSEDAEGFADYGRSLPSVQVSVLLKEVEVGVVRASIRSKGAHDVSQVASKFGGGGHRNAAGCTLEKSLDKAIIDIVEVFKELDE